MKKIDQLTGRYSLSKTLGTALLPVGRTEEFFRERFIQSDIQRDKEYEMVKKYIDRYHISFIDDVLKEFSLDERLSDYASLYYKEDKTDEDKEQLEVFENAFRDDISKAFKKDARYSKMFGKELICDLLPSFLTDYNELEVVEHFRTFTTYFAGFNKVRENLYSNEAKHSAIGNRCVTDNLPRYLNNAKIFNERIINALPDENIIALDKGFYDATGLSFSAFFEVDYFSRVLSQTGIDAYNTMLGGYSTEDGKMVKGLNQYISEFNQANARNDGSKLPFLTPLYKQLLSEKKSFSFIPEKLSSDKEVFDSLTSMYKDEKESMSVKQAVVGLSDLFTNIKSYDQNGIFIPSAYITEVSSTVFGSWKVLNDAWNEKYDVVNIVGKVKYNDKYVDKRLKAFKSIKSFSVEELQELAKDKGLLDNIVDIYKNKLHILAKDIHDSYLDVVSLIDKNRNNNKKLYQNEAYIEKIKIFLDNIKAFENMVKMFKGTGKETGRDDLFYSEYTSLFDALTKVDGVYTKVRNYLTQKPYSNDKIRLNFDNSQFLSGWAQDYVSKGAIYVEKDGKFYLMVLDKKLSADDVDLLTKSETDNMASRIVYKFQKSDNKNIPRLFIYSSAVQKYNLPIEDVRELYDKGWFKTSYREINPQLYKESLVKLIDYFKQGLSVHESYSDFTFKWKPSEEYRDISEFYNDVKNSTYLLKKERISFDVLMDFVNEGKIYLFQVWMRDFSDKAKGVPSLHSMYFNALFDEENLKDVVFALNGGAQMFYREASIAPEDTIVHLANEPIKNKNPLNPKKESVYSYDIIKDRRYTKPQFSLHIPVTMNFKQGSLSGNINYAVRDLLKEDDDTYVIGIDRGERNLLHITVINSKEEIVEQISLNKIKGNNQVVDYYKLLSEKEEDRLDARKNWKAVEGIKNLKEGYLAQVLHIVCQLIEKYDAVVAIEDLTTEFKKGRVKIEKAVYQKFETMLTNKLCYMVNKNKDKEENGGFLHGYQLASVDSKDKFQNGFIFKVSSRNTSNVDPVTGFVDLLRPKYTNRQSAVSFFEKFNDIRYDASKDMFVFEVDYAKFDKADSTHRTVWAIHTNGDRIYSYRDEENSRWRSKYVDLTASMRALFEENNIDCTASNLKEQICSQQSADFFKQLIHLLNLTLQMKNNPVTNEEINFFISPVMDNNGVFFDSRDYENVSDSKLPKDTYANDAYNIARKALWAINSIKEAENPYKAKILCTNQQWFEFVQK